MRAASVALVLVVVVAATAARFPLQTKIQAPGAGLSAPEIIKMHGYPVEVHYITTEDGYILEVHRIPHGINDTPGGDRQPVLLQHCILCSSAEFIMGTPNTTLGFILADAGYDVWIGNHRGNTYARNHTSLDPEKKAFWKFSLDEMAQYDLPATIDAVLAATGRESLLYVGFSMGTTTFFAMMSERPEYESKVKTMVALAPAAYMEHIKGVIGEIVPYMSIIDRVLSLLGTGEFLALGEKIDEFLQKSCDQDSLLAPICYAIVGSIAGPDPELINKDYFPVYLSHTPAGTSLHTFNQYAQMALTGEFKKYDYGRIGNNLHYGQKTPPLYNLNNVKIPVSVFWGANDYLVPEQDSQRLANELPNLVLNQRIDHDNFNHLDFVWALHADELVYRYVLEVLQNYRS